MRRTSRRRPRLSRSQPHHSSSSAARAPRSVRPWLEVLEERVQPGDTLLGVCVVALAGLGRSTLDTPLPLEPDRQDCRWQAGPLVAEDTLDALSPQDWQADLSAWPISRADIGDGIPAEAAVAWDLPGMLEDPG